jgi:hypothetical protein
MQLRRRHAELLSQREELLCSRKKVQNRTGQAVDPVEDFRTHHR